MAVEVGLAVELAHDSGHDSTRRLDLTVRQTDLPR
jgi:hypothetical protein